MKTYISALKSRIEPLSNPYFSALREGTFERDDFVETQVQFLFAVVFFSRPMLALAARLPRPEMRLGLLENVSDEHGGHDISVSHEATFVELLARLGVTIEYIDSRVLWPEVRAFNTVLAGMSTMDDPLSCLACLGIIEDLFSSYSAELGKAITAHAWLPRDQLVHYAVHAELDVEHAEDFYKLLYDPYANDKRAEYQIQQGLEVGAYIFTQMYRGLYEARTRRWERDVGGAHSTTDGWYIPRD